MWFRSVRPNFHRIGYLLVANDWTDVRQDLSDRVRISVVAGIATLLLIVALIALAVRRYISRPLAELSRRVISFSTDEATAPVAAHDLGPVRDEVELLIGEFRKLGERTGQGARRPARKTSQRDRTRTPAAAFRSPRHYRQPGRGLAHEIGTPMGVIRGRAEYLAHSRMDPNKTAEGLEIIIAQIDRITSIVRMLLDYSRYRESLKMTADLRPIVQRSIHLIETEATKRGVAVRTELGERTLADRLRSRSAAAGVRQSRHQRARCDARRTAEL